MKHLELTIKVQANTTKSIILGLKEIINAVRSQGDNYLVPNEGEEGFVVDFDLYCDRKSRVICSIETK
jgi:hypothetical protein